MTHGGDSLAKMVAQKTQHGGLMVLGPMDFIMRKNSEKYIDPDGYFPVFTHASSKDFHLYFGIHQGLKVYGAETLADLIKQNESKGLPIRLLGCESGVEGGIAKQLAKLLPDNPVYAPDGFCQVTDGKATVYKKRPGEMKHLMEEPPEGQFIRIVP